MICAYWFMLALVFTNTSVDPQTLESLVAHTLPATHCICVQEL